MGPFEVVFPILAGVFGLFIGSFLNVLIFRLPNGEDFVHGRSHCPRCGHDLGALDLVPVLSYLALGRRCRYCKAPISGRYALVEGLTGVLFALAAWFSLDVSPWLFLPFSTFLACALVVLFIRYDKHRAPLALVWTAVALGVGTILWVLLG